MRLSELDARFLGNYHESTGPDDHTSYREVDRIEDAQGVIFQCPKCAIGKERGEADGRKFVIGAHSIICWFANPISGIRVPANASPKPGRWNQSGTGLEDLTFIGPGAYSVQVGGGCNWHGFIRDGATSET